MLCTKELCHLAEKDVTRTSLDSTSSQIQIGNKAQFLTTGINYQGSVRVCIPGCLQIQAGYISGFSDLAKLRHYWA